jgi:hypothetical protein
MLLRAAVQAGGAGNLLWAAATRLLRQILGMLVPLLVWKLLLRSLRQPENGRQLLRRLQAADPHGRHVLPLQHL